MAFKRAATNSTHHAEPMPVGDPVEGATPAMPDWLARAVEQGVKPEQALAFIGLGLMGRLANGAAETPWIWSEEDDGGATDLAGLRQVYPEDPLPAASARRPTTVKALKTLIDADRASGYGISQGGFETGITTIAAPVFNEARRVVAAVSITVPQQQISREETERLVPLVRLAAEQLTQRLSHLPHPAGGPGAKH